MSPKCRRWSRNERIIRKYYDLLADGSKTMEAYRLLAKRYNMSVGGIRYAIKSVEDMLRPVAPPLSDEEMNLTISKNQI